MPPAGIDFGDGLVGPDPVEQALLRELTGLPSAAVDRALDASDVRSSIEKPTSASRSAVFCS